jgi:hypothetical protein
VYDAGYPIEDAITREGRNETGTRLISLASPPKAIFITMPATPQANSFLALD